ncbi:recombinase family protein, partial [Candidatus Saccharibacteria bacterium]|nr:recombinase family protein [Candidatus Saccharibacteria bacterium]
TKSISRFARNTVDSLTVTRDLKSHGVEVFFEKENISSMDPQAELIFTIMSSVAQEESRSISENVRWGRQRSMEAGKVSVAWSRFLGYEKGPDGLPKIVEEEAKVVRDIYQWFLNGKSFSEIAKELTIRGIKTPGGKDEWQYGTVRSILTNEKYKGDARLQKTYTVDFLTKEVRVNHGERKQWYIHDSHDAIIDPGMFELVQKEIARRCHRKGKYYDSPFANKLICGQCGAFYSHKTWHSDRPSKKCVWRCVDKYEGPEICRTPKLEDDQIIEAYLIALNRLMKGLEGYTSEYKERFLWNIGNNTALNASKDKLYEETQSLIEMANKMVEDNARRAQNQESYEKKFNELCERIEQNKSEIEKIDDEISANLARREEVKLFLDSLKDSLSQITKFDIRQWHHIVEDVVVMPNQTLVFHFRTGQEETVKLEEVPIKRYDGSQS